MRPSGYDQQGDPQMYIATTHRHTHANHRSYNGLHAPSTARRHRLVAPCVAPHRPLRSVKRDTSCGLIASPLAGADFATHPHGSLFESVCNTVANTKKFLEAFATALQTPESFSRHLQHRCKHQKNSRSICNTVASAKKFFAAFATPLQAPKSFSSQLQHRCKHQKVFRGICNTVANVFFSENQALYKEPCPRSVINPFLS